MPAGQKRQRQSAPNASVAFNASKLRREGRAPAPAPARKSNGYSNAHQPPYPTQQSRPQQSRPPQQQFAAAPSRVRNGQQEGFRYDVAPPSANGSLGMHDMGSGSGASEAGEEGEEVYEGDEGDEGDEGEERDEGDEGDEGEEEEEEEEEDRGGECGQVDDRYHSERVAVRPSQVGHVRARNRPQKSIPELLDKLSAKIDKLLKVMQTSNKEQLSMRSATQANNENMRICIELVKLGLFPNMPNISAQLFHGTGPAAYRPPQEAADPAGANQFPQMQTQMQQTYPYNST